MIEPLRPTSAGPRRLAFAAPLLLALWGSAPIVGGCGESTTAKPAFAAAVSATPETGNAPLSIHFVVRHNGGLDSTQTYSWDFGDGGVDTAKEPDHVFEQAGVHHVVVVVTDSALGDATAEMDIDIAEPADLLVRDIVAEPSRVRPGADLHVSAGLANQGADPIGSWSLTYVLSMDAVLSEDDPRLKTLERQGSPTPPLESLDETFTLPADLPTGEYFVGIVVDEAGSIGDADRANNTAFAAFPVKVENASDNGPDLVICGLDVPAFAGLPAGQSPLVQQGDQLEVHFCLANGGNVPTPDAAIELYLSADGTVDAGDLQLFAREGVALGNGDRFEDTLVVDVPIDLAAGDYSLIAVADPKDVVSEQLEDNNIRTSTAPLQIVEPGDVEGVDLVVTEFAAEAARVFWSQTFPVTLKVLNRGHTGVQRNFVVRVEAEPSNGGEAVTLASLNVGGLAAGAESALDTDVPVSRRVPAGEYCLRAVADPTGSTMDANPGNNRRRSICLTLGGEPDVDLAVRNVAFSPAEVAAGAQVTVTGALSNGGQDASGPAEMAVVLSLDSTFSPDDVVIDRFEAAPIPGGGMVDVERMAVVPVALDQNVALWHVGLVADPNVRLGERSHENNAAFAPTALAVTGAMGGCAEDDREDNDDERHASAIEAGVAADLGLCDGADWFEVVVPADQVLTVTARVGDVSFAESGVVPFLNIETQAGALLARGDIFGQSVSAFVEPAAVERTLRFSLVENTPLTYSLTVDLSAAGAGPQLRPRYLSVSPGRGGPGGFVSVNLEAVNLGAGASTPTTVGVYLVAPGAAPTPADALGSIPLGAVAPGAAETVDGVVTLPAAAADGTYELVAVADDAAANAEADEGDNEQRAAFVIASAASCPNDPFEPNRGPTDDGAAPIPAVLAPGTYEGLAVCGDDDDWYAIDLAPGDGLTITASFIHANGDVDIELLGPDGVEEIDSSRGTSDEERVEFFGTPQGGRYFLHVKLYGGGEDNPSNTYALDVEVNPAGGCVADMFEPNGTTDTAAVVADGDYVLTLCPGNSDWFRFSMVAGNTVTFRAQADQAVLLTLYGPNDAVLDEDDLAVSWDAAVDGVYRLKVASDSAVPVSYSLRVRGASGIDLEALDLSIAPESASPGEEIRVVGRVRNDLGDVLRDVPVRFLLSTDEIGSVDDTTLGDAVLPRVGNVEVAETRLRVRLPADAPAGPAFVLLVVDPDRQLADARRANNALAVPLLLRAACVDDDPRDNEGPATATPLDWAAGLREGGAICAYTEDWFRLTPPAPGRIGVHLAFDAQAGDLDLFVYDAATGMLLGESATEAGLEEVAADAAGDVLVRVDGFLDAENTYGLTWEAL